MFLQSKHATKFFSNHIRKTSVHKAHFLSCYGQQLLGCLKEELAKFKKINKKEKPKIGLRDLMSYKIAPTSSLNVLYFKQHSQIVESFRAILAARTPCVPSA